MQIPDNMRKLGLLQCQLAYWCTQFAASHATIANLPKDTPDDLRKGVIQSAHHDMCHLNDAFLLWKAESTRIAAIQTGDLDPNVPTVVEDPSKLN